MLNLALVGGTPRYVYYFMFYFKFGGVFVNILFLCKYFILCFCKYFTLFYFVCLCKYFCVLYVLCFYLFNLCV
jgi:hypothetical protein